ncbi:Ig-like domain-containing protein [Flammeovirgaceae bacterium SG7u.111]|nr:Ig-like domain-containing protein [Flammeovirgaceae bacterium SG7u.132]WPO33551.1 Ig-like domain-containing protein [Flammeovirgaceae bacterium SG7u.111]
MRLNSYFLVLLILGAVHSNLFGKGVDGGDESATMTLLASKGKMPNAAPVIIGLADPNLSFDEDTNYTLLLSDIDFTDDDAGDTHTLEIKNGTYANIDNIDYATNTITPDADYEGDISVIIRVYDGTDYSAEKVITITVDNTNDAPVINGLINPNLSFDEDTDYTLLLSDIDFTDIDVGDTHTLEIIGGPYTDFTFDASNKISPVTNFVGDITFTIRVSDGTDSDEEDVTIIVNPIKDIPAFADTLSPPATVKEDLLYSYKFTATDGDGETLSYFIEKLPGWATFDGTNGLLSGTPENDDVKNYTDIKIFVTDGNSAPVEFGPFNIEVTNENDAPTISGTPPSSIGIGFDYIFEPSYTDIDLAVDPGEVLTFSLTNKPGWLTVNTTTGKLTGSPAPADEGTESAIILTVTDDDGLSASIGPFDIEVFEVLTNEAPIFSNAPNASYSINEDTGFSFDADATDDDGDELFYYISSNNKPDWLTINTNSGEFSGTPDNDDVGSYTGIVISVTDNKSAPVSLAPFDIEVVNINDAPQILANNPISAVNEKSYYEFIPNVEDVDIIHGDKLTYSIEDTTGLGSWLIFDPNTGKISGTPDYDDAGFFSGITIKVTDKDGPIKKTVVVFDLTVINVNRLPEFTTPPSPATSVVEGNPYLFEPIATDEDTVVAALKYIIANQPSWANFDTNTGKLSGIPTDGDADTYSDITISVTDNISAPVALTPFDIEVLNVNNQPTLNDIATSAILEDADEQTIFISGITDGDIADAQTLEVTATAINDPKGLITNLKVEYTSPDQIGKVKYTPAENLSGTAEIQVTVDDKSGTANGGIATISKSFVVEITPVNDAPVIDPVGDQAPILEDATKQTITLSGIGDGDPDVNQTVNLTVRSSNTSIIPDPVWDESTSTLTYTPVPNANGTVEITITLDDESGNANGGSPIYEEKFNVTVTAVNDDPTLAAIPTPDAIPENAGEQTIILTGIGDGDAEIIQPLTITATSNNTTLINNITITYVQEESTAILKYTPETDQNGTATISVKVDDGADIKERTFDVEVLPVNSPPTIDNIATQTVLEDSGLKTVDLTGITDGDAEVNQTITITALSSDPSIIPNPVVNYSSGSNEGTLSFTPEAEQNGQVTITVRVTDDGTENNQTIKTFVVNVTSVNDEPTIDPIGTPSAILEDAAEQTISLLGISDGDVEREQRVLINVSSSNTDLIPNPTVIYTDGESNGSLKYKPAANKSGTAEITVTISDDGGVSNNGDNSKTVMFLVEVTPVNDAPTISDIPNPPIIRESTGPQQVVNLAGITDGDLDFTQNLTVTAVSSNKSLVQEIEVDYVPNQNTGLLLFSPVPNQNGVTTITVKVKDDGGTLNNGVDSTTVSFELTVEGRNNAPTIDAVSDQKILEDSGPQTIRLRGIRDGDDGSQKITLSATSSNPGIIPVPDIAYDSGDIEAILTYAPVNGVNGSSIITVMVQDDGGTANGGVDSKTIKFEIEVAEVNDKPTIDPLTDTVTILEDSPLQTINLTGISDGDDDRVQAITVSATSSNPELIPNPVIEYTDGDPTATLTYKPKDNLYGNATITVTVQDDGGSDITGQEDTKEFEFVVVVLPVNDAPGINPVEDQVYFEDETRTPLTLSMIIKADPTDLLQQVVSVVATSSNPAIVPNPSILYSAGNVTAEMTISPLPQANGTVTITVTVLDDGGTENGGKNSTTIDFKLDVIPSNDAPTLNQIIDQAEVLKNAGKQVIPLTNITDGDPDLDQNLTITAVSSDPSITGDITIDYDPDSTYGTLSYTPLPDARGEATITVTVKDDGGVRPSPVDGKIRDKDTKIVSFKVKVGIKNNAPVIVDDGGDVLDELDVTTPKDMPVEVCLNIVEIDQDEIVFAGMLTEPEKGEVTFGEDMCMTYTPASDQLSGNDFFEIVVCDDVSGDQACDTLRINMVVNPSENITVYDGISPGFDGKNDKWVIDGIENFEGNTVQIYNKTGMLVFSTKGYNNETVYWEGQSNSGLGSGNGDKILPKGVYFYVIDFGNGGAQLKGYVLIR